MLIFARSAQKLDMFLKQQQGDGSFLVWIASGFHMKINVIFFSGRIRSLTYQDLFEEKMLPFSEKTSGIIWMFQQDNAFIYTANNTWEPFF